MNSQDFNHNTITLTQKDSLLSGISWYYAQFIQGDIDEQEFSDLIDLQIELNQYATA